MSEHLLGLSSITLKLLAFLSLLILGVVQLDTLKKRYPICSKKEFLIILIFFTGFTGAASIFIDDYMNGLAKDKLTESQEKVINELEKQIQIQTTDQQERRETHKRDSSNYAYQTNGIKDSVLFLRNLITSNEEIARQGNIYKLLSASHNLQQIFSEYVFIVRDTISIEKKVIFLKKAITIIDDELANPILSNNKKLSDEWFGEKNGIDVYIGSELMPLTATMPEQESLKPFFNKLKEEIFTISSKTSLYCWDELYLDFKKQHNGK